MINFLLGAWLIVFAFWWPHLAQTRNNLWLFVSTLELPRSHVTLWNNVIVAMACSRFPLWDARGARTG
jgi:formate/nitrite transporter FocA (FNT family)